MEQAHQKTLASLANRLADLENKFVEDIAGGRDSDVSEVHVQEMVNQARNCSKEVVQMQAILAKEQDFRAMQIDNFNKLIMQERTARETQLEGWRAWLASEKDARDGREKGLVTKEELDVATKAMWNEIRTHTHDVHAFSVPNASPAPQKASPSRSPSPMPPGKAIVSPKRVA